jgi:hypothetical protein
MNKSRRKEIESVINDIEIFQSSLSSEEPSRLITQDDLNTITDFVMNVESIYSEEEEYRDNMPENLQNSERFNIADEACNNLENALDYLQGIDESTTVEDCTAALESAVGSLSDAAQ